MKPHGDPTNSVDAFLEAIDHPSKPEIVALRAIILGVDDRIGESVKWKAPSFYTTEHFATFNLRAKEGVQVVLHLGATPRPDATVRASVTDPSKLLVWKSADRATVTFRDLSDVKTKRKAFADVVRQWIEHVLPPS